MRALDSEGGELVRRIPLTDGEHQPLAGQRMHDRGVLGHSEGVVQSNSTFVPIDIRSVRIAIAAAATNGEGRNPSGVPWCSDSHTAEYPSCSASTISPRHSS